MLLYLFLVGIWCDLLGGIHMWRSPLCWCSCHDSAESAPQCLQTGQTQQYHLLRWNVCIARTILQQLCTNVLTACLEIFSVLTTSESCKAWIDFPYTAGIWWCRVGLHTLNSVQCLPSLPSSSLIYWSVKQPIWSLIKLLLMFLSIFLEWFVNAIASYNDVYTEF